jgi:hypothetical protein
MSDRLVVLVLSLVLTAVAAAPATAQGQRVFVHAGTTVAEIRSDPARLGDVIQTWALPSDTGDYRQSRVVGHGRYLVLDAFDGKTVVLDTISGAVTRTVVGRVFGVISEGRELVTYTVPFNGVPYAEVVSIATGARRQVQMPEGCVRAVAVAERARQLVVLRAPECSFGPPQVQWIDLVSLDGGPTRERVVDVAPGLAQTITTNPEGTRLWVTTRPSGFSTSKGIAAFDLTAGRLLAEISTDAPAWPSDTRLLPGRNLLLSVTTRGLTALDPESLRVIATADAPRSRLDGVPLPRGYPRQFGYTVLADDDAESVIVYEFSEYYVQHAGRLCVQAALIALDPDPGQRLGSRDARSPVSGELLCALDLTMAVAPPAPAVGATVEGARVTLAWQPSPDATHYEVEAGSAPGLRNLARFVTGPPSLVAESVPPGTDHVRVRALNYAGKGAYTADLLVTVP